MLMPAAQTNGYVSVGFGDSALMTFADTITGWVSDSSGIPTIIDELSPDYNQPQNDISLGGSLSVSNVQGEQTGGWTTLQFTRLMVTGDPYDYWIGPNTIYMIYAIGKNDGCVALTSRVCACVYVDVRE